MKKIDYLVLAFTILSSMWQMQASVEASSATNLIYGVDASGNIHEVNLGQVKTDTVLFNAADILGADSFPNAFAYDTARNDVLFISKKNITGGYEKTLWHWMSTGDLISVASGSDMAIPLAEREPDNAAYYGNAFWFFRKGTNKLHKISMKYTNGYPQFDKAEIINVTLPEGTYNIFGDIAISKTGILYAATAKATTNPSASFYTVDLNSVDGSSVAANVIKGQVTTGASANPSLQVAFSSDHETLYAHSAESGKWFTMDVSSGNIKEIEGFTSGLLRDIGGSSAGEPADIPDAVNDNYRTLINTPVVSNMSENDDVVQQGSTFSLYNNQSSTNGVTTSGGVIEINADTGDFKYTPPLGFVGVDSFEYSLCFPSPFQNICDTATVSVAIEACRFNTLTQGGWPNKAHNLRLASLFDKALVIGNPSIYTYTFDGKANIQSFLPSSGNLAVLYSSEKNPVGIKNTFAGQLVTLSLNARANPNLDIALFDTSKLTSGMVKYFSDNRILNVGDLLARANSVIGGGSLVSKAELSLLTGALEAVTLSWHEGIQASNSPLYCPSPK